MKELAELSLSDLIVLRDRAGRKFEQHQINKERGERLHEIGEDLAEQARKLSYLVDEMINKRVMWYIKEYN